MLSQGILGVLGLHALHVALAAMVDRFRYRNSALAALPVFIGSKVFVADLLGITFAILAVGIGWSLWKTRGGWADGPAA